MTVEEMSLLINESKLSPLWQKAFKEYNDHHNNKLSMACKSCYPKVVEWHLARILKKDKLDENLN